MDQERRNRGTPRRRAERKQEPEFDAQSHIVKDYVGRELNINLLKTCESMVKLYSAHDPKMVLSPNFQGNTDPLIPPTGFSFSVKDDAKIKAEIFHPHKMFYGTAALPLEQPKMKNGKLLTKDYVINNRDAIKRALNEAVPHSSSNPVRLGTHFDAEESVESKSWTASLGDSGSYAGLYVSSERDGYVPKNRFWLVVQSGNKSGSEDLYREMEKAETEGMTWNEFFFQRSSTTYLSNSASRNRKRLLASVANALNLDLEYSSDPHSMTDSTEILTPAIDVVSYNILSNRQTRRFTYHAATVDPNSCSGGIVLNENPYVGPVILKGPFENGTDFGKKWPVPEGACGAFPVSTGRSTPIVGNTKNDLAIGLKTLDTSPFVWNDCDKKVNLRLAPNVYRIRDESFKNLEDGLGYSHVWGEIQLSPLVVKIACSDQ
jgi:hypothetical protein